MTEFVSPFALHSRRPLRIRAIGVAAAAIAGTFSLLFPTSAAETGFRIPDWPLARAGRLEATSPGQANPNATSDGYSPAGTIPSAGAAIARPPQRSAENGGKFELVRDDPSPADAESGDAAAAETGVRASPPRSTRTRKARRPESTGSAAASFSRRIGIGYPAAPESSKGNPKSEKESCCWSAN